MKLGLVSLHNDAERFPPMGLVYIATYLEDKIGYRNTRIYDTNFERVYDQIIMEKPDIIGISAMTVEYGEAITLAKKIKKTINVPIIIGGVHISTLPTSFNKIFDLGIVGEGEETMKELVENYLETKSFGELDRIKGIVYFDGGKIKINEKREPIYDLDSIPIPNHDYINKKYFERKELPSIQEIGVVGYVSGSRSCPYHCVFCSTTNFWGQLRLNSPAYVIKSVKELIDKYDVNYIKVFDDLFTINKDRVRKLIEGMKKQGILGKVVFECQPRANLIDEEMCSLMKELGVRVVNFGFESGSDRTLGWLKANSVTVEMNKKAIILCKKYGFRVYGSLMVGSPGEKIEDMERTLDFIDFAIKNKADYIWSFVSTPFPATQFWEIAKIRGKVNDNMDWNLLSHHNIGSPLLLDSDVSNEEFKHVMGKIRKKLRKMKYKIILNFITKNPLKTIEMILTQPKHYITRFVKQMYMQ